MFIVFYFIKILSDNPFLVVIWSESFNKSTNQLINKSTNQSINKSISREVDKFDNLIIWIILITLIIILMILIILIIMLIIIMIITKQLFNVCKIVTNDFVLH